MAGPLAGRGIVVTRPVEQARTLTVAIARVGGRAISFPSLEIADVADPQPAFARIDRLDDYDLAIFISPVAARRAAQLIRVRRGERPLPPTLRLAAIGRGSLRELEFGLDRSGSHTIIAPDDGADSDALLSHPALAEIRGHRIAIFRGEGGRERLAEGLRARGAQIDYIECYRRVVPHADARPLLAAWSRGEVHAVTLSSTQGCGGFFDLIGDAGMQHLRVTPVFVLHERIAEAVRSRGIGQVIVAGPGDEETLAALVAYFHGAQ